MGSSYGAAMSLGDNVKWLVSTRLSLLPLLPIKKIGSHRRPWMFDHPKTVQCLSLKSYKKNEVPDRWIQLPTSITTILRANFGIELAMVR